MAGNNYRLSEENFNRERDDVLSSWPSGRDADFKEALSFHRGISGKKNFALAMKEADEEGHVLLQPRAGVALVDEHIRLLRYLEETADLLPTTIDAYTRQNRYEEAQKGIEKSLQAGRSLLNGFPAVNHGVRACRRVVESVRKPVEIRHGTPDARLLAEITLAAGFTSYEGGGISYNIPYTKKIPLETSIAHWRYVDRLVGKYQEEGVTINREPFGPLSGTLVPPCISHSVAVIEGILALEQGVTSITLGYGQAGNFVQDIAAMYALKECADTYFKKAGFSDYHLSTVFHQWMGGFPEDESKAFGVICWGSMIAALSGATKVIVKTPHEAMGIPTMQANLQGLKATRQVISMLREQAGINMYEIDDEKQRIIKEVNLILNAVERLGDGDWGEGAAKAFKAGIIDVPFAPSIHNSGKLLPVRDNKGAIRIMNAGGVPLSSELKEFHSHQIEERSREEQRDSGFQMVIDDIYAISKGRLVGRPN